MNLEEISRRLHKSLQHDPNVHSIGIAAKSQYNPEDKLFVYTYRKPKAVYPTTYEGVKVEQRTLGKIEIRPPKTRRYYG